jgi:hypothetical protein
MTLSQVKDQFEYWRKHPPTHELVAIEVGFKPELTIEERWAQGVMGPKDFAVWVNSTDGKQVSPGG